jgi:flavoprotein
MAIAQRIAATAMFASVAVAAASPVWADPADQMSGTYTVQSPNDPQLSTWTITPCGSTCINVASDRIKGTRQARLVNLEWVFSTNQVVCPDGNFVPGRTTYSWNPYTLTGTRRRSSNEVPACGVTPIDDAMILTLTRAS